MYTVFSSLNLTREKASHLKKLKMNLSGSCLLMERANVKSKITTMMICSRRNENNSLLNVIIVMSRTQMSLYWSQLGPVKQRRFCATNVNRKWTLCILEQLLWLNIEGNCLYKTVYGIQASDPWSLKFRHQTLLPRRLSRLKAENLF